jgi:YesN/AraC family two-component response regulator
MEFVESGDAALRACSERTFDVVISDLRMPGMDGAQLLSEIRDRYPGMARIVLSGYSDAALAAKAVPVATASWPSHASRWNLRRRSSESVLSGM